MKERRKPSNVGEELDIQGQIGYLHSRSSISEGGSDFYELLEKVLEKNPINAECPDLLWN